MTDITDTLAPNSDQLDAVDLLTGPRTFTVERVVVNKSDQPVNVHLRGFPRVWRPGKNMRRVLASLWGADSAGWTDHSVTLYCDKTVRFGGETVGGIRISHMSHIDGVQKASIIPTRGKSALWTVQPLADAPRTAPNAEAMTDRTRRQMFALFGELNISDDDQRKGIELIIGHPIASRSELTETEAQQVVTRLKVKKAESDAGADPVEPGLFEQQEQTA